LKSSANDALFGGVVQKRNANVGCAVLDLYVGDGWEGDGRGMDKTNGTNIALVVV
jgi:hypothetical protein